MIKSLFLHCIAVRQDAELDELAGWISNDFKKILCEIFAIFSLRLSGYLMIAFKYPHNSLSNLTRPVTFPPIPIRITTNCCEGTIYT
jgi:hypothetical protein